LGSEEILEDRLDVSSIHTMRKLDFILKDLIRIVQIDRFDVVFKAFGHRSIHRPAFPQSMVNNVVRAQANYRSFRLHGRFLACLRKPLKVSVPQRSSLSEVSIFIGDVPKKLGPACDASFLRFLHPIRAAVACDTGTTTLTYHREVARADRGITAKRSPQSTQ